jgi:hypothetical protein
MLAPISKVVVAALARETDGSNDLPRKYFRHYVDLVADPQLLTPRWGGWHERFGGHSMLSSHTIGRRRTRSLVLLFSSVLMFVGVLFVPPVSADEPGETTVGYLLVQQALGHLLHDSSEEGVMVAMEKIDDALATDDQEGVDLAQLEQAQAALEAGMVQESQDLLQASIGEALGDVQPAVGEETGTTIVMASLPGRGGLAGGDWVLILASVLLVFVGVALAWLFRPQDNIHELRQSLGAPRPTHADPSSTAEDSR